jgi:hypothetical protein
MMFLFINGHLKIFLCSSKHFGPLHIKVECDQF